MILKNINSASVFLPGDFQPSYNNRQRYFLAEYDRSKSNIIRGHIRCSIIYYFEKEILS